MKNRPLKQKVIGILGGCSNVATVEYYKMLNSEVNKALGGWEIAETLIVGMNFGNIEAFVRSGNWQGASEYLKTKLNCLEQGGAEILICASNTLHKVLAPLVEDSSMQFIHIADPTGAAIKNQGLSRVALFGTKPTMQLSYLREYYQQNFNIEVFVPSEEEQAEIDRIIFDELVKDSFLPESRESYLQIFGRMQRDLGVEGLIMGCTEIFLLLEGFTEIRLFNTSYLHCQAAVKEALS